MATDREKLIKLYASMALLYGVKSWLVKWLWEQAAADPKLYADVLASLEEHLQHHGADAP